MTSAREYRFIIAFSSPSCDEIQIVAVLYITLPFLTFSFYHEQLHLSQLLIDDSFVYPIS